MIEITTLHDLYIMQCCFHKQLIAFGKEDIADGKLPLIEKIKELKDLFGGTQMVQWDHYTGKIRFIRGNQNANIYNRP